MSKTTVEKSLRNITRIENSKMQGWRVRYHGYHKYFNDNKYDGEENGLIAAKAFLHEAKKEAEVKEPRVPVIGLSVIDRTDTGHLLFYLYVQLKNGDQQLSKRFPISMGHRKRVLLETVTAMADWCERHYPAAWTDPGRAYNMAIDPVTDFMTQRVTKWRECNG